MRRVVSKVQQRRAPSFPLPLLTHLAPEDGSGVSWFFFCSRGWTSEEAKTTTKSKDALEMVPVRGVQAPLLGAPQGPEEKLQRLDEAAACCPEELKMFRAAPCFKSLSLVPYVPPSSFSFFLSFFLSRLTSLAEILERLP